MTILSEHNARTSSASNFVSFKRWHPANFPDGVDAIVGKDIHGRDGLHAIRFNAKKHTADVAKAWLEGRGAKVESFTAASMGFEAQSFSLAKRMDAERLVFGWGYITRDIANKFVPASRTTAEGIVVDWSGETVNIDNLEKAIYEYVEFSRVGDVMHDGPQVATIVESMVFTPAKKSILGLADDFPEGVFLGYRVNDDAAWGRVCDGDLAMFSLAGTCTREEI